MMQNYLYPEYKIEKPINAFSSDGFLAGWKDRLSSYEPIHFDPFPSNPEIRFQVTKIQLPADFLPELDKIEAFYDLHLQELVPISVGDRDNSHQAKENPCGANRGKLVG